MTTESLMTEGQDTQVADAQQAATTQASANADAQGDGTTQQSEVQDAQGQQTDGDNTDNDAAKPEGAPEKYEFKPAEGQQFDAPTIDAFSEVAKELNLSQDAAQKVLDKMAPVIAARQLESIQTAKVEWGNATKADKEIGGNQFAENLGLANKALDTFGTPELRGLLKDSGLSNHPEVIRFFYRTGKAISEDKFVGGKVAAPSADARSLYPNSNMTK